ncbi:MAG: formyltransferase family protein [Desulfocapsaceae bacterium]|nr:formyltransferase family protein [Desulfocapsaceae bacterium]
MRFAIAAADRYLGVFETFVNTGWKPVKLFTMPVATAIDNHQAVSAFAERHHLPIQLSRITQRDFHELQEMQCDALIVACYGWRIGDWQPFLKYAVNFHSSPLPDGRGPYPLHQAILENRPSWGITCHRLADEFDTGDIMAAEIFPLQHDECHESLDLKLQMAAKKLAAQVAERFVELWNQARPQTDGSYWFQKPLEERVIDFQRPVEDIIRHVRAFGATESVANINGTWLVVKQAVGWSELHDHPPGTVVHVNNRTIVVAALDGYIGLLEPDIMRPDLAAGLPHIGGKA